MAPNNGKPSEFERRVSLRRSVRLSVQGGDEDEFALAALGISDGFRPEGPPTSATTTPDHTTAAQEATSAYLNSQPVNTNPDLPAPQPTPTARPSSIAKKRHNDSFSLRHDGVMGPINESVLSRQSSVSTENPFVAVEAERPYEGPSGPSHPYQMYPQNVRAARTASIATTSTAAPLSERPYNGPRGPSHPYGMYPQNTIGDAVGTSGGTNVAPPIPVGFPGMTDQYRRRVGPDGEHAELIGPDGHTEELPPYTRYPEGGYAPKPVPVGQQSAATATIQPVQELHNGQPSSSDRGGTPAGAIPVGAGGIGLATQNPEFSASTDDFGSPRSRYSAQSFASGTSRDRINAAAEPVNEKPAESKWKQQARKKLWGIIPYWAICLVLTAVVLMGIIVGAVIGTFLSGPKGPRKGRGGDSSDSPAISATVTVTLDATPLQTKPADLRSLEIGDFALPIVSASRQSASCFNNTLQANAWSCTVVFAQMMMSVVKLEGNPDTADYAINLSCNSSLTLGQGTYSYGTQPPCFNKNLTMNLVTDIFEPNRGPAWFFQYPYDKVVMLREEALKFDDITGDVLAHVDNDIPIERRGFPPGGGFDPFGGDFKRKSIAQPGEKPWICTWGGTLLEVFVYANQDSNCYRDYTAKVSRSTATATGIQQTPSSNTSPTVSTGTISARSPGNGDGDDSHNQDNTSKFDKTKTKKNDDDEETTTVSPTTTITNESRTGTADPGASTVFEQWAHAGPPPPPPYPRVVKVEERRMSGLPSRPPSCQQWEIMADGTRQPVKDSNGKDITIQIQENESGPTLSTLDDNGTNAEETGSVSRRKRDGIKKVRMSREEIMRRFEGVYYVDENGYLKQRDAQLVGNDLSNCGCLWWSY